MGKPPAYIFVVRHGARLDQADKTWHLSAQNPYDPPLTYGGWRQAQAVGARIAAIVREAEFESEQAANEARAAGIHKKRKRFRVVVHTSPFLRCVQTSIGITAGLARPISSTTASPAPQSPPATATAAATADALRNLSLRDTFTEEPEKKLQKTPLRIDAFLGEWLNPEYFESITRPPHSDQMLAAAKVALLRKEVIPPRPHSSSISQGHDKLWSSPVLSPTYERTNSMDSNTSFGLGLDHGPAMASVFGSRRRTDSGASSSSQRAAAASAVFADQEDAGYIAPTPHYAASTASKIPDGYVAHARDACTAPDYQWDTSQSPWLWGDGGEYGEEWITMHRRFRKGLQRLVDWYATTDDPTNLVTKLSAASPLLGTSQAYEPLPIETDEEEAESVVVLVSHGAGCNAMIGAITRQPVLMDVGVATLTMAQRKNDDPIGPDAPPASPDADADAATTQPKVPVDQYYDLKIQASNDHLRNLSTSSSGLRRNPSVSSNPGFTPPPHPNPHHSRGRVSTMNSAYPATSGSGLSYPDLGGIVSRSNSASANLGGPRTSSTAYTPSRRLGSLSMYNGITVGSGATSFTSQANSGVPSLWTPTAAPSLLNKKNDEEEEDEDDMLPDFDGTRRFSLKSVSAETEDATAPNPPQKDGTGGKAIHSPA